MAARLRVTQVKSTIGHIARNRGTVRALGLKRIGHTVEVPDNPATRGMVRQVRFLVEVETVGAGRSPSREAAVASASDSTPENPSQKADAATDGPPPDRRTETAAATPRPRRAKPTAAAKEEA
jgi:large subunit ribosomal protein L30